MTGSLRNFLFILVFTVGCGGSDGGCFGPPLTPTTFAPATKAELVGNSQMLITGWAHWFDYHPPLNPNESQTGDIWIARVRIHTGHTSWRTYVGTDGPDEVRAVIHREENGAYLVGGTLTPVSGGVIPSGILLAFDDAGDVQYAYRVSRPAAENMEELLFFTLEEAAAENDRVYVLGHGATVGQPPSDEAVTLLAFEDREFSWSRRLDTQATPVSLALHDGTLYIVAVTDSSTLIFELDPDGELERSSELDGLVADASTVLTDTGDLIVAGGCGDAVCVARVDDGEIAYTREIAEPAESHVIVESTEKGAFVVAVRDGERYRAIKFSNGGSPQGAVETDGRDVIGVGVDDGEPIFISWGKRETDSTHLTVWGRDVCGPRYDSVDVEVAEMELELDDHDAAWPEVEMHVEYWAMRSDPERYREIHGAFCP